MRNLLQVWQCRIVRWVLFR